MSDKNQNRNDAEFTTQELLEYCAVDNDWAAGLLEDRIAALEARVRELEAQPREAAGKAARSDKI
jgi:hypothetical protein